MKHFLFSAIFGALLICACSSCRSNDTEKNGDAGLQDSAHVDSSFDGGGKDREISFPDGAVDGEICWDAAPDSIIELPIKVILHDMPRGDFEYPYGVYSDHRFDPDIPGQYDIFLFNMLTETEQRLTETPWGERDVVMHGQKIVWADMRDYSYPENRQIYMYEYDIETEELIRLTESTSVNWPCSMDATNLLYRTTEGVPEDASSMNLVLWNRITDEKRLLADYTSGPGMVFASSTHVTWSAYSSDVPGRQVYIHDIEAAETIRLESTIQGQTIPNSIWNDKVVWRDNRGGDYDIYLYDAETGQEQAVVEDPFDQVAGHIRKNLLVYIDFSRTKYPHEFISTVPSDIVILDLETGYRRRINSCPRQHSAVGFVHDIYVFFYRRIDQESGEYLIMDLLENGILDENLNVIPDPDE